MNSIPSLQWDPHIIYNILVEVSPHVCNWTPPPWPMGCEVSLFLCERRRSGRWVGQLVEVLPSATPPSPFTPFTPRPALEKIQFSLLSNYTWPFEFWFFFQNGISPFEFPAKRETNQFYSHYNFEDIFECRLGSVLFHLNVMFKNDWHCI